MTDFIGAPSEVEPITAVPDISGQTFLCKACVAISEGRKYFSKHTCELAPKVKVYAPKIKPIKDPTMFNVDQFKNWISGQVTLLLLFSIACQGQSVLLFDTTYTRAGDTAYFDRQGSWAQGETFFTVTGGGTTTTFGSDTNFTFTGRSISIGTLGSYATAGQWRSIQFAPDSMQSDTGITIQFVLEGTYVEEADGSISIPPSPGYRESWFYWNARWWTKYDFEHGATDWNALLYLNYFDDGKYQGAWLGRLSGMSPERFERIAQFANADTVLSADCCGMASTNNGPYLADDMRIRRRDGQRLDMTAVKKWMLKAILQSRKK